MKVHRIVFLVWIGVLAPKVSGSEVFLDSRILNVSFTLPILYSGDISIPVKPTRVYTSAPKREVFCFELKLRDECPSLEISVGNGVLPPRQSAEQIVAQTLAEKRGDFTNPIVEVTRTINTFGQNIAIITTSGNGGEMVAHGNVYFKPDCLVSVSIGQLDFAPHPHPDREELAILVEKIIKSLRVAKK